MKHKMTLFIADRKINELMKYFGLKPDYKEFVIPQEISFDAAAEANFFLNLIEKSKTDEKYWIPAIQFGSNLYHDPSVKELSDGQQIMFV